MSAISNFLNQIKTAIYGEQVRDAIHDSILQCYTDVTNAKTIADQSTTSANNAAASANTAATKANNAATSANNAAQSATTAANTANAAANNASNAKEAANSAASVATSAANQANDAASAANTAKTNADTATQAANAAAGAANTAAEAANTAATNANTAKDNAVAATEAVNAAAETINEKAVKSGTEPDLTAGTAEQLMSDETVKNAEPYKFRRTAGTGNRAYLDKIIGGSVVWNQLAMFGASQVPSERSGLTFASSNDMAVIINGTSSSAVSVSGWFGGSNNKSFGDDRLNHVMLIITAVVNGTTDKNVHVNLSSSLSPSRSGFAIGGSAAVKISGDKGSTRRIELSISNGTVLNNYTIALQYFDLTQMFGSTIADYVYNLEQANAGAGVEWFRKIFHAEYYPYNAGELISVSGLSEHKTIGFNLWDGSMANGYVSNSTGKFVANANARVTDFIPVLPDTDYYIQSSSLTANWAAWYDCDKNFCGGLASYRMVVKSPSNARYIRCTIADGETQAKTVPGTFVINLSNPSRNGEYEPYAGHSYPLDSSLTLRGIPKLDTENNLYWDADEYTPNGKVKRKYGIVDLGTLNWSSDGTHYVYNAQVDDMKKIATNIMPNIICVYGIIRSSYASSLRTNMPDKTATLIDNNNYVIIRDDAYTDAAAFKTAMSGVMLVYELATPTEESAESYAKVQVIDPAGTEEFVSESILPVGHETRYMVDLKDRLEHLPDQAANDGLYAIQQTDGKMELVNATFSPYVVENASGAIASFSDGADNLPVKNLVVNIEPVQAGSGDPSPDNVRPISGWTGVKISRTGKNLWNKDDQTAKNGYYNFDGSFNYNPTWRTIAFRCQQGFTYTKSGDGWGGIVTYWYDDTFVSSANSSTVTVPSGVNNVRFACQYSSTNAQLELSSTVTEYEPYAGNTYEVTLPTEAGTVYGGTLDVVNGELTVDKGIVDLGTRNWDYANGYFYCSLRGLGAKNTEINTVILDNICSQYRTNSYSGLADFDVTYFQNNCRIRDSRYTDKDSFKSAMSGVMYVFELAEPITYHLTPTQVKTLLGQNNIFADAGDTSVDYIADTKLYIDKKFAELKAELNS